VVWEKGAVTSPSLGEGLYLTGGDIEGRQPGKDLVSFWCVVRGRGAARGRERYLTLAAAVSHDSN